MADSKNTLFQAALAKLSSVYTLKGLAEKCGIQRATLSHYASGRSRPSIEALEGLAENLPPNEGAPLILAHLLDECPACIRPYLTLETVAGIPISDVPNTELDALLAGIRALAEERQEVRDWLSQSYAIMR